MEGETAQAQFSAEGEVIDVGLRSMDDTEVSGMIVGSDGDHSH